MSEKEDDVQEKESKKLEIWIGVLVVIFATVLSIEQLGADRYGDDEKYAVAQNTQMYSWYQSKSIKQALFKGQVELMDALEQSKAIKADYKEAIDSHVVKLKRKIAAYDREMNEIKRGSNVVGKENWAQDLDGKMGQITGADEWASIATTLGSAGDAFDLSTLFLQVSLSFGLISLVVQNSQTRRVFMFAMLGVGLLGTYYAFQAFMIAFSA